MARTFEPSPHDATSLAAFRWFANTIENEAMALFVTERESYRQIEDVLRRTLRELKYIKTEYAVPQEENGCPDGWVLCNGVCQPSCDGNLEQASSLASADVKKK